MDLRPCCLSTYAEQAVKKHWKPILPFWDLHFLPFSAILSANSFFPEDFPVSQKSKYLTALKAAFPYTIPIFAGFTFLGMTYGIYMNVSGFSFWYPMLMSMTIFAGSMEFVAVNLLLGAFNPLQALAMTLMLNARHHKFRDCLCRVLNLFGRGNASLLTKG